MTRAPLKRQRANSLVHALRLCKEYAQAKRHLSVERIADRMGASHDSLYKWLATGRLPANLIPVYELACGCNYVTDFLAAGANRLVIPLPTGRKVTAQELPEINVSCAQAVQELSAFYLDPASCDTEALLDCLRAHLEQVAFHHRNVGRYEAPELDFDAWAPLPTRPKAWSPCCG